MLTESQVKQAEKDNLVGKEPDPETVRWLINHVEPVVSAVFKWSMKQAVGGLSDVYIESILKAAITPRVYWSREHVQTESHRDVQTQQSGVASSSPAAAAPVTTTQQESYWDFIMEQYPVELVWGGTLSNKRVVEVRPSEHLGDRWRSLAKELGRDYRWSADDKAFVLAGHVPPSLYQAKRGQGA